MEELKATLPGTRRIRFATRVCCNCDARFSCAAYRQYAWKPAYAGVAESRVRYLYDVDRLTDAEREQWRTAGLDAAPDGADLE